MNKLSLSSLWVLIWMGLVVLIANANGVYSFLFFMMPTAMTKVAPLEINRVPTGVYLSPNILFTLGCVSMCGVV